jgi:hypothetical protein
MLDGTTVLMHECCDLSRGEKPQHHCGCKRISYAEAKKIVRRRRARWLPFMRNGKRELKHDSIVMRVNQRQAPPAIFLPAKPSSVNKNVVKTVHGRPYHFPSKIRADELQRVWDARLVAEGLSMWNGFFGAHAPQGNGVTWSTTGFEGFHAGIPTIGPYDVWTSFPNGLCNFWREECIAAGLDPDVEKMRRIAEAEATLTKLGARQSVHPEGASAKSDDDGVDQPGQHVPVERNYSAEQAVSRRRSEKERDALRRRQGISIPHGVNSYAEEQVEAVDNGEAIPGDISDWFRRDDE